MEPSRKIDRRKVFIGVGLICAAVLLMLFGDESASKVYGAAWIVLLGAGLIFYLMGRFFSRGDR